MIKGFLWLMTDFFLNSHENISLLVGFLLTATFLLLLVEKTMKSQQMDGKIPGNPPPLLVKFKYKYI